MSRIVLVSLLAGVGCTTKDAADARPTTTTSTVPRPTTTLAPTADPAFGTHVKGILTVGTDADEAPFLTRTGDHASGIEQDVVRAIANRLQVGAVRFVPASMTGMVGGLDCTCDLYVGRVRASAQLARSVDLSEPYVAADQAVLRRSGAPLITPETAAGLRWATTLADDAALRLLDSRIRPSHRPVVVTGRDDLVAAVVDREVDAALVDAPWAVAAAEADPRLEVVQRYTTGEGWVLVLPLGSSGTPSLNDILNDLTADGTLAFIARRWLGRDPAGLQAVG